MLLNKQDKKDLIDFAKDHIEHFDAIPCEFETCTGTLVPYETIWNTCKSAGLLDTLT